MAHLVERFDTQAEAIRFANSIKKEHEFLCVIESRGAFYVEDEPPMIRLGEDLIREYENGKIKK